MTMIGSNENLPSRRFSRANGACSQSQNCTICSINVGSLLTHMDICRDGEVIDSACFDLGYDCLQIDSALTVTQISDGGETFLDAVAKRIRVGDKIEPEMIQLLGELIAETIINLVARKKPPQVSQRLLNSEPLAAHYQLQKCIVSGFPNGDHQAAINLRVTLSEGLAGALRDRNIDFEMVHMAPDIVAEGTQTNA
jgi:ethanolamine utilization protein EutA (predicted chaperonin)